MPEAVIVATARTPDRPGQQGLARRRAAPTTCRRRSSRRCSTKVPAARPADRRGRDLGLRPARPARPGYNIARVVGDPRRPADVPGVTVNRYCSSSLQTIRMAAHAIKAGEGDVLHRRAASRP